jgi:hypothetical protein
VVPLFVSGQEDGNEFVTPLGYLAPGLLEASAAHAEISYEGLLRPTIH